MCVCCACCGGLAGVAANRAEHEDLDNLADARKAAVDGALRAPGAVVGKVLHLLAQLQPAKLRERLVKDDCLQHSQHLLRHQVHQQLAVLLGHLVLFVLDLLLGVVALVGGAWTKQGRL